MRPVSAGDKDYLLLINDGRSGDSEDVLLLNP